MKNLKTALWTELLKVRKSGIFWLSILFFAFVSFMMGLIMYVQMHPEVAQKIGLIGTKASLMESGEPGWQSYFLLISQAIAGIGLIGYGFITSWIFGREYSENTIKDILALPVSRSVFVYSKLIVVVIWSIILSLVFYVSSLAFGCLVDLPGWSNEQFGQFTSNFTLIVLLSILLSTPVAFFSSYSRGFLLPIGIVILTMLMANFTGLLGLGAYFPWAIPGMLAVPFGHLGLVSYFILIITCVLGLVATLAWWQYADQK